MLYSILLNFIRYILYIFMCTCPVLLTNMKYIEVAWVVAAEHGICCLHQNIDRKRHPLCRWQHRLQIN